ncbi:hypothetical protein INR49_010083 [Caranx melampygus]|nr:hypothetical protein INR49_010083 [Caranx melampygus]
MMLICDDEEEDDEEQEEEEEGPETFSYAVTDVSDKLMDISHMRDITCLRFLRRSHLEFGGNDKNASADHVHVLASESCEEPRHVKRPVALSFQTFVVTVQQEQMAAIFLLLRENQEALGEVTEGDMEEQLKLYSL